MSLQTSETSSVLSISRFHRISPANYIVRVGHCWLMMIPSLTLFPVHLTAVIDTVSMSRIILVGEFLRGNFHLLQILMSRQYATSSCKAT